MRSIEARLKRRLLVGSVALSALLALAAWQWAGRQVRELLDYQLEQVARALVDHDFARNAELAVDDPAMHLDIVVWNDAGRLLYRSSPEVELSADTVPGFSRVRSGPQRDAVMLRLFTLRSPGRVIQVAHPLDLRQDLAREAGLEALAAVLSGTAVLSMLIVFTVRRSLAPLRALRDELARRDAQSLAPIALPGAPTELQQPLATLNALLARLDASLTLHRQFIADAAHELRTPLAALRLQVDNVTHAADSAERDAALAQLRAGLDRAQHLVQQLLELARLEGDAPQRAPTDVAGLARDCLVDHAGEAAGRSMELALEADAPAVIEADPHALRSLLDNLVGNALKYAPPGSPVVVALERIGSTLRLAVRDRGPGIEPGERERVLERFWRGAHRDTPGSGLGLAIAAEAARRHGARLELRDRDDGPGLEARVDFPLP